VAEVDRAAGELGAIENDRAAATWIALDGHVTDVRYAVFTDWTRPDAAIIRVQLIPRWSGTAKGQHP